MEVLLLTVAAVPGLIAGKDIAVVNAEVDPSTPTVLVLFTSLGSTTMVGRKRGDIPKSLVRGRDRFEIWRRSRKVGARIPDKLWSVAVTLAESHGPAL